MKVLIKVLRKYCCVIVIIAFACGCSGNGRESIVATELPKIKYYRNDVGNAIYTTEIEGHLYIVMSRAHGGGIIHAEHCPCKNSR